MGIHCHVVITMKNGLSCKEMELAKLDIPKIIPVVDDKTSKEEVENLKQKAIDIVNAKKKMIEFNSLLAGVFALHPELNPTLWPPPLGQNPNKPSNNVLRQKVEKWDDPDYLYDYTSRII